MKKLKELNSEYKNIESTSVLSTEEMNALFGGKCGSCADGCKQGCQPSCSPGGSQGHPTQPENEFGMVTAD